MPKQSHEELNARLSVVIAGAPRASAMISKIESSYARSFLGVVGSGDSVGLLVLLQVSVLCEKLLGPSKTNMHVASRCVQRTSCRRP